MHAYIHTQPSTHTHTHTLTPAHTHGHTQHSKFARRDMGSMSSTGKNILNITQENVAVFRRRARKLCTDGDARGLRGAVGPLV